jgi:hypothetical protein
MKKSTYDKLFEIIKKNFFQTCDSLNKLFRSILFTFVAYNNKFKSDEIDRLLHNISSL